MRKHFIREVLGSAALAAVTALVAPAHAEPFGRAGDVSFAADRLMGFYLYAPGDGGPNYTLFSLGMNPGLNPYAVSRLGIDGFVTDHLSIGGSLAFWSIGRRGSATGGMVAPRVGYAIDFSDSFGFWPRGGLTYMNFDGNDEFALTLEGMFYASPAPHFAFIFGPAFDIGFANNRRRDPGRSFGVMSVGVLGWI